MKRNEEPNKVKERPTAPFVLISVPGLVAKLAVHTAVTTCSKSVHITYTLDVRLAAVIKILQHTVDREIFVIKKISSMTFPDKN